MLPSREPSLQVIRTKGHLSIHLRELPSPRQREVLFERLVKKVRPRKGKALALRIDVFIGGEQALTFIEGERLYVPLGGDFPPPPVLPAKREGNSLRVDCCFCDRTHSHGIGDDDGAGHREAHCVGMKSQGYVLEPMGKSKGLK